MNSVRRSVWLSLADSYVGLVLQIVSTMIISRVLTPADVGIVAIAMVFSGLASMFRDFGIAEYMIQERELDRDKIAAALSLNIIVSWAMAAVMYVGGPFAAEFYGNPGVSEVMRVQAIAFLLVPFGAVTMAYFRRELNMQPVMICGLAGSVTSFAVAVTMVLQGFGYISMAWANVASVVVTVGLSVLYRPAGFPRWPSLRGVATVFHFSKFVSLMYMIGQIGKGMPELIIGRAEGVVAVAMYSRGNGIVELFNRLIVRPVWLVCMPYYAKSDREGVSIASAYTTSVSYITVVSWPFLAFLALAAFPAIRIMYGPQWDDAVMLAQVLCLARAIDVVHMMSREALLARGLARDANSLQTLIIVAYVLGLMLVFPFGLQGAVWGIVLSALASNVLSQYYASTRLGLAWRDLLRACRSSLYIGALAVAPAALWALVDPVGMHNYVAFGVGGALLTAACWVAAVRWLGHPLFVEIEPLLRRLAVWRRVR